VLLARDGSYTVTFWSVDKAGNVEDVHTARYTIATLANATKDTGTNTGTKTHTNARDNKKSESVVVPDTGDKALFILPLAGIVLGLFILAPFAAARRQREEG
jgi:hypothetical protein